MGGDIWLQSKYSVGSTFSFTIKVAFLPHDVNVLTLSGRQEQEQEGHPPGQETLHRAGKRHREEEHLFVSQRRLSRSQGECPSRKNETEGGRCVRTT